MVNRLFLVVLPLALAAVLLTGCGGGGGGNKVTVELREWAVVPASTTIKSGKVTFEAKNTGTINHELRVKRLGGAAPTVVDVIPSFPAGQTKSKEFTLTPGRYELSCELADPGPGGQIINHYQNGMHIEITVE